MPVTCSARYQNSAKLRYLVTARVAINRALTLAPTDPDILFEAGHVAAAEGDQAAARRSWEKTIAADPNGPTARAARQALALLDVPFTVTTAIPKANDRK